MLLRERLSMSFVFAELVFFYEGLNILTLTLRKVKEWF